MSYYLEMNELVPTFRGYFVTRAGAGPGEARRDLLKIGGLAAFHANCHHLYLYLANRRRPQPRSRLSSPLMESCKHWI